MFLEADVYDQNTREGRINLAAVGTREEKNNGPKSRKYKQFPVSFRLKLLASSIFSQREREM